MELSRRIAALQHHSPHHFSATTGARKWVLPASKSPLIPIPIKGTKMADSKTMVMIDGNAAAAYVAHACSEVIAIYPITPSSPMGELSDEFSAMGRKNLWGTVPQVVEMQS